MNDKHHSRAAATLARRFHELLNVVAPECFGITTSDRGSFDALGERGRLYIAAFELLLEDELVSLVGFSDDEKTVIQALIVRIDAGRDNYGPLELEGDERHFPAEATYERVDALFYELCQAVRDGRA